MYLEVYTALHYKYTSTTLLYTPPDMLFTCFWELLAKHKKCEGLCVHNSGDAEERPLAMFMNSYWCGLGSSSRVLRERKRETRRETGGSLTLANMPSTGF